MEKLKTIGLSQDVYFKLLDLKHDSEMKERRAVSFSDTIENLIKKNNGNKKR